MKIDKIPKTTPEEIDKLVERLKASNTNLAKEDVELIERLLKTISFLVSLLQRKNLSIKHLKRLLFGGWTEKHKSEGAVNEARKESEKSEDNERKAGEVRDESREKAKVKIKGHGRRPAEAFKVSEVVGVKHELYKGRDDCPEEGCKGRLYDTKEPLILIQFEGHPPVTAIRYEQQVLRCGLCGERYRASLPEGVKDERYRPSADAAISVYKYGSGQPWYRQSQMQASFGLPLSESVQWERSEEVANACHPIYKLLRSMCSNSEVINSDDTGVKILSKVSEKNKGSSPTKSKVERKGTYTSVLIGTSYEGRKIALYVSGSQHAGENLSELLEMREDRLPQLIQMSDALSANTKGVRNTIVSLCLAHGRRKFYDLKEYHPEQCNQVLDLISKVYETESETKQMSGEDRLKHHQSHSEPIMSELKRWLDLQVRENLVEPNSGLGAAIAYMRRHWDGLTKFLKVVNSPIDNNAAERGVKRFVLFRKNSLFYKNETGAAIGNVLHSIIETCRLNNVNPMKYLEYIRNNTEKIKAAPEKYLPWNYDNNECEQAQAA